jgi:hypothetical protein
MPVEPTVPEFFEQAQQMTATADNEIISLSMIFNLNVRLRSTASGLVARFPGELRKAFRASKSFFNFYSAACLRTSVHGSGVESK